MVFAFTLRIYVKREPERQPVVQEAAAECRKQLRRYPEQRCLEEEDQHEEQHAHQDLRYADAEAMQAEPVCGRPVRRYEEHHRRDHRGEPGELRQHDGCVTVRAVRTDGIHAAAQNHNRLGECVRLQGR